MKYFLMVAVLFGCVGCDRAIDRKLTIPGLLVDCPAGTTPVKFTPTIRPSIVQEHYCVFKDNNRRDQFGRRVEYKHGPYVRVDDGRVVETGQFVYDSLSSLKDGEWARMHAQPVQKSCDATYGVGEFHPALVRHFDKGKLNGSYVEWDHNGCVLASGEYVGVPVGDHMATEYSPDGLVSVKTTYNDKGEFVRQQKILRDSNVLLLSIEPDSGLLKVSEFYKDGSPRELSWRLPAKKGFFSDDARIEGKRELWYANGERKLVCLYTDGKPLGDCTGWYENGEKRFSVTFIDDKRDPIASVPNSDDSCAYVFTSEFTRVPWEFDQVDVPDFELVNVRSTPFSRARYWYRGGKTRFFAERDVTMALTSYHYYTFDHKREVRLDVPDDPMLSDDRGCVKNDHHIDSPCVTRSTILHHDIYDYYAGVRQERLTQPKLVLGPICAGKRVFRIGFDGCEVVDYSYSQDVPNGPPGEMTDTVGVVRREPLALCHMWRDGVRLCPTQFDIETHGDRYDSRICTR